MLNYFNNHTPLKLSLKEYNHPITYKSTRKSNIYLNILRNSSCHTVCGQLNCSIQVSHAYQTLVKDLYRLSVKVVKSCDCWAVLDENVIGQFDINLPFTPFIYLSEVKLVRQNNSLKCSSVSLFQSTGFEVYLVGCEVF